MYTQIRLKIRDFFKKNKKIIIIIAIVWTVIIVFNYILEHMPKVEIDKPSTTYEPHVAVMDNSEVPQKLQSPIEKVIKEFIDACNAKDYDKAYELLSEDCRRDVYPDKEYFEMYVDSIFDQKKIYNIQNFSNKDNYYIYKITILNDIMATGLTGEDDGEYNEETYVIKEEKGNLKLAINGYIGNNSVDQMYEDDNMKITIDNVKVDYGLLTYDVKIRNKSEYTIVIEDFTDQNEVLLNTDMGNRSREGLWVEPIILKEGETKTFHLSFTRFFDEAGNVNSLIFGKIRILKSYTGREETRQAELDEAVDIYGIELEV